VANPAARSGRVRVKMSMYMWTYWSSTWIVRSGETGTALWRRRCVMPPHCRRWTSRKRMLRSLNLLLCSLHLQQSVIDILRHFRREYRARIQRLGYWLLPRPQQTFHRLSRVWIHDKVGIHECFVHIAAEINRIGCADILDDGVKHIQSWELKLWSSLPKSVSHLVEWTSGGRRKEIQWACWYILWSLVEI
jgi:hypothetical protein